MRPIVLSALFALIAACSGGRGAERQMDEPPGGAVTLWTDSTELFMEHPALIVGQPAKFAVHLTDVTDFAPLCSGRITLRFARRDGGEPITVIQDAPRMPGIFGPSVEFGHAGLYDLVIRVDSPQARDSLFVPGLRVFGKPGEVPADPGSDGGIPFLKEQQWKTSGFATTFATEGTVAETFDAPGEVVPAAGKMADVAAPIGGLVDVDGTGRAPVPASG